LTGGVKRLDLTLNHPRLRHSLEVGRFLATGFPRFVSDDSTDAGRAGLVEREHDKLERTSPAVQGEDARGRAG
jgi:hypothetical protein